MNNLFDRVGKQACLEKSAESADVPSADVNFSACKLFDVGNRNKCQASAEVTAHFSELFFVFFAYVVVNDIYVKFF